MFSKRLGRRRRRTLFVPVCPLLCNYFFLKFKFFNTFNLLTCLVSRVITTHGTSVNRNESAAQIVLFFQVVDKVRSLERTECGCCVHRPPVHGRFLFLLSRLSRGFSFNIQDSFRVFCSGLGGAQMIELVGIYLLLNTYCALFT